MALTNKRVFARFGHGEGYPDGPIVDAEGCVWTGVFGGWGLRRYSPQGELLSTLRLPCSAVTKAAFAGDDLKTLYITTAHVALDAEQRKQQPLAGGLFRVTGGRSRAATGNRVAWHLKIQHNRLVAASARATGLTIQNTSTWWRCISSAS